MGKIIAEIIMALFKKENRRTLWESVTKIPPALKYCLIFAIIVGFGYFGYRKVETMMDMTRLQAELAVLQDRVNNQVNIEDYTNDIVHITCSIKILDEMQTFQYNEHILFLDLFEDYVKKHGSDPLVLYDIEAAKKRNKIEYESLQRCIQNTLQRTRSILVADSLLSIQGESKLTF